MDDLLELACPSCAAALPAAPHRRVFVCPSCQGTFLPHFSPQGPALVPIQRDLLLPSRELPSRGSIVLLPLWQVPVPARACLPLPPQIRVPALGMERMQLLVNFATHLTRSPAPVQLRAAPDIPREPAQLAPEDAFEVGELVAMGVVPGWPDDELVANLQIPLGAPRLVDLPCQLDGLQLIDLAFGRSVSAGLLDGHTLQDRREAIEASLSRTMN